MTTHTDKRLVLKKAERLLQNGQATKAATLCKQAVSQTPGDYQAWYLLGKSYETCGAAQDALNCYLRCLQVNNTFADANTSIAMLLHKSGAIVDAERYYRSSLSCNPEQPVTLFNLAALLQTGNRTDEAISLYEKALAIKPDYAKAHANLGYIYRQMKHPEKALYHYQQASLLAPDIPEIHFNQALVLQDQRRNLEAVRSLETALKLKPDYAEAHFARAISLTWLSRDSEAEISYRKAIRLDSHNLDAFIGLSNVLCNLDKLEQAEEYARKAAILDSDNLKVHCLQCRLEMIKGNYHAAHLIIAPWLENQPVDFDIAMLAYELFPKLGNIRLAVDILEYLISNNRSLSNEQLIRIHFSLGELYDKLKSYDKAFQNYDKGNRDAWLRVYTRFLLPGHRSPDISI